MIIVELAGHLGADPEVRFSPSGQKITTLRIATNVRRQGKEETVWWRAVVFGDHLDKMISFLKKGSAVIVFGKMNPPQIYNDKNGQPQVQLEIIASMIEFSPFGKSDRSSSEPSAHYNEQKQQPSRPMESSYGAPAYDGPAGGSMFEAHSQYSPQHQSPFMQNAEVSQHNHFPEEDNVPF